MDNKDRAKCLSTCQVLPAFSGFLGRACPPREERTDAYYVPFTRLTFDRWT